MKKIKKKKTVVQAVVTRIGGLRVPADETVTVIIHD